MDAAVACAKRKSLIVKITLAALILSTIFALLSRNTYTGRTKILPPQQSQSLNAALIAQLTPLAGLAGSSGIPLKNPNEIYLSMLQSETVLNSVIRRYKLMELFHDDYISDARVDLLKRARFGLGKEGIISVEYDDVDPKRAADVANAFVEELQRLTQTLAFSEAGRRRLFFEQQVAIVKDQLSEAEVAMRKTQESTGLIQAEGQARAMIEAVGTLQGQITTKEVQLSSVRSYATEQNPDRIRIEHELDTLHAQMEKLQRKGEKDGIELPVQKVPAAGLEYLRRLRDVKYYESMYELLSKQYEIARIDETKNAAVIQQMDPALLPDKKTKPFRRLIIMSATLIAFVASLILAILLEHLERWQQDPQIVARQEALRRHLNLSALRFRRTA
jgi:tyrosine-protein kinase Etk/Wzc